MKACIATSKRPADFESFLTAIEQMTAEYDIEIQGYVITTGSGCANHGIMLEGIDSKNFLDHLTMALMPARWTIVPDDDMGVSQGRFEVEL